MKKITLLALLLLTCFASKAQISLESSGDYGKLHDLTYDAFIANKIYATTFGNHIVVSNNDGADWEVLFSYPDSGSYISDLRLLPGNTALSFATRDAIHILDLATNTLTQNFTIPQSGVAGAGASYLNSYAVADTDGNVMLVDTGFSIGFSSFSKVFYTEDAGNTWQEIYYTLNNDNVFINNVAISPEHPQQIFLARGLGDSGVNGGIWMSEDAGVNWTQSLDGVSIDPIAFKPANSNEILIGSSIGFGIHPENLYKSIDSGLTWEIVPISWTDETLNNITSITYCPTNNNKIIILDENEIVRTEDGGENWTNTVYPVGISMDYYYGLGASYNPFNENQIAITTDFYPQLSNDGGLTLTQIKAPFHNISSTSFGKYGETKHLFYGAQGGRLHKDITSGVTTAYDTENPDSFNPKSNFIIADPLVPGRIFTYASMGFFGGFLNLSTDYGATTTNIMQAFSDDMQELAVDPQNTNIIYVSLRSGESGQLYKIDFTDLENIISAEIITPEINEFNEGVVTGIIINPANSNEIYISKKNLVYKSIDGGTSWEEKSAGLEGISSFDLIWDMVKNPLNPNQFTLSSNVGIFTTLDAAENWTQILSGNDVKRVKHSPINDGLIVGTIFPSATTAETSIVYSVDNGENWTQVMPSELGFIQAYSADFDFDGNNVNAYLGTYDLGVIKYTITDLPLGIENPATRENFVLYPNPASDVVNLIMPEGVILKSFNIYSITGQKVLESETLKTDISGLSRGTYIIKAQTANNETLTGKLIKN